RDLGARDLRRGLLRGERPPRAPRGAADRVRGPAPAPPLEDQKNFTSDTESTSPLFEKSAATSTWKFSLITTPIPAAKWSWAVLGPASKNFLRSALVPM